MTSDSCPSPSAPTAYTSRALRPHTRSRPPGKSSCTSCQVGSLGGSVSEHAHAVKITKTASDDRNITPLIQRIACERSPEVSTDRARTPCVRTDHETDSPPVDCPLRRQARALGSDAGHCVRLGRLAVGHP